MRWWEQVGLVLGQEETDMDTDEEEDKEEG